MIMKAMESARCAALGLLFVVMAGCASQPRHFLDPADRSPVGGREAVVLVPQGEIKTLVVASQAGAAFGLVGAIIDVSVNQHRANAAEKSITPLRTALTDYHFDQQALAATEVTVARMDWLAVRKTSFSKDMSKENTNSILDKSASPEILFVSYSYELSPDFAMLQVDARFSIFAKAAPKGQSADSRMKLENAAYSENFTYLIPLAGASDDVAENCRHWSDDNAVIARRALVQGIGGVNALAERGLVQTSDDVKKLQQGAKVDAGGRKGKLIEKTDAGTLLLDDLGNWVFVAESPAG
jgi:hypothetical protein